ncbi:MAG: hypothetical protein ACRDWS_02575 [Acidimicrobiia bacterium]
MTVRIVCDFHADPESQVCHDCGLLAWRQQEGWRLAHEDFSVHDELWDAVCPDDAVEWLEDGEIFREGSFVLCIGCFEERLGRQLTREDFKTPPGRRFGLSPSYRLRSRWKARRQ